MAAHRANAHPNEEGSVGSGRMAGGRRVGKPASSRLLPESVLQMLMLMLLLLALEMAAAAQGLRTDPLLHPIHRRKAIVNGQTVGEGEQPYVAFQVGLFIRLPNGTTIPDSSVFCGGSIIAPSYILTAAHCFSGFGYNVSTGRTHWNLNTDPKSEVGIFIVFTGKTGRENRESGQERAASKLWIHKDYVEMVDNETMRARLSDDLAILKLKKPLSFSDRVRSIALSPEDSSLRVNTDLSTAGWGGLITRGGPQPKKLQMVTVNHLPNVCAKYLISGSYKAIAELGINGSVYFDEKSMICAGCEEGGTGICPGDSGGPLFALSATGGCPVQVGVTSWLTEPLGVCAFSDIPDVYARVSRGLSWIESVVGHPVRSTVPLNPTANCENCLANDFPDGENCDKASRYDIKQCDIQARLAASFTLKKPVCVDGKLHELKAYIHFSKGFSNGADDLKKKLKDGHVFFLYSDEGAGHGVISLPLSSGNKAELINTPLKHPKVLATKVAFDAKEGAWVYSSSGCSPVRTYAALFVWGSGNQTPQYRQISLPVRK